MTADPTTLSTWLVGERNGFRWYHVEDVRGAALDALAAEFGLHDLAVEDCRNQRQRAKLEEYDRHLFLIVNTLHFDADKIECWFGEFNIFVGEDFVITVHDGPSRTAAAVRPKFAADARLAHPGRLLYALLDFVVDRYLPVLDTMEERMEALEEICYAKPSAAQLEEIFRVKRALIEFRRVATMMRELVNQLLYRDEPWLRSQQLYIRNVYDHVVRALEFVDTYRDILTGVLDVHLTATANRTNETMKVLTIYATLATPFLLVTGYYGMNFEWLPLLHDPWGPAVVTAAMFGIGFGMLWYFRRKGWL